MTCQNELQHELRKEFQNMLGILKIIKRENAVLDTEIVEMIDLCLERETNISARFDELTNVLEVKHVN
jgi:hypothetical protein